MTLDTDDTHDVPVSVATLRSAIANHELAPVTLPRIKFLEEA